MPWALNVNPIVTRQPFNVSIIGSNLSFSFEGKFVDNNNKQTFRVNYTNNSGVPATWDVTFTKIKSLLAATSFTQIVPNLATFGAPRCQQTTRVISFSNVTYGNPWETPPIGYGSITNYEYLLPIGWTLNSSPSTGNWIAANNSVSITSDFGSGDQTNIRIRPVNTACGVGLQPGQEVSIPISRPAPNLTLTASQNFLCTGTATITANGIPAGASIIWTLPTGNTDAQLVGCNTCPSVSIQRISNSNTVVTVTATITHCSFIYVLSYDLGLGIPNTTCQQIGNGTCNKINFLCPSQMNNWQFVNLFGTWGAGGTGYHLQVNGGGYFNNGLTTQDITTNFFSVYVPSGGNNVTIWAMNACGVSGNAPYVIGFYPKSYGCGYSFSISPNPASSTINVSSITETTSTQKGAAKALFTEIQIIDNLGNLKRNFKYGSGLQTTTLDISGLTSGLYIVRVKNGASWEEYKVSVVR